MEDTMRDILTVDRLEIVVLVDNVTDSLSSNPPGAMSEWAAGVAAGRIRALSGGCTCCAHHGLSLLITAFIGEERRSLLFDAGPEAATWMRNVGVLGVELAAVESIVLSHGHWDHAGGLLAAIEAVRTARAGKAVECFVHPGMFADRGMQRPGGEVLSFDSVPQPDALAEAGATLVSTREAQAAGRGAFYVSAEIPRVTSYETGFPGHVRRAADGQGWEADPLLLDERFVSVLVRDKGQFVFSACSHAGVINVLKHAASAFPSVPLYGVMGGLHLAGATEGIIPQTIADLKTFGLKLVAPGHCTGWRALNAIARALGEELIPSAVGKRFAL